MHSHPSERVQPSPMHWAWDSWIHHTHSAKGVPHFPERSLATGAFAIDAGPKQRLVALCSLCEMLSSKTKGCLDTGRGG